LLSPRWSLRALEAPRLRSTKQMTQTMLDDERLHQTLLRGPQKMCGDRRQLCRALNPLACFGRWRNLTIYLRISLWRRPAWRCFDLPPFCPNPE
jgi:hypothetical protein